MVTEMEAKDMVERVVTERKHANDVIKLLSIMEQSDENILRTVTHGLCRFFAKTLKEIRSTKGKTKSAETQIFMDWANDRYREFLSKLIDFLDNTSTDIQRLGIFSLVIMIEKEMLSLSVHGTTKIPEVSINNLIKALMCSSKLSSLQRDIQQILRLVDLRYFTLKLLPSCMAKCLKTHEKQKVISNVFQILECISKLMTADNIILPESQKLALCKGNLKDVIPDYVNESKNKMVCTLTKAFDIKENKRLFSNTWLDFLRSDLDQHMVKLVLCLMQKHIIPNFGSPCVLSDFLTHCFNQGGGVALLSLHGLFVLMTEHNLEYPKFYEQLYGTVHPRIFDSKYQSRFFYLLDIFLSSTHLPVYIIAAFAKKLSRLLLVAPSYALPLLVNFILTLIERHPTIKVLTNRPKSLQSKEALLSGDPYLASQEDPALCKAMESSLWELTTLNHHFLPCVSQCVTELDKGPQHDIHTLLDNTYLDMFDSLTEKKFQLAPMNYSKPVGLFGGFEDVTVDLWTV